MYNIYYTIFILYIKDIKYIFCVYIKYRYIKYVLYIWCYLYKPPLKDILLSSIYIYDV